jgi:hypothetical protein
MTRHPSEGSEDVAIYYVNDRKIEVYGFWSLHTPNGQYDYFDIYLDDSLDKLNDYPWYRKLIPTREETLIKMFDIEKD